MQKIWIGSDNSVAASGVKNAVTDEYINDGLCSFTLCDANGAKLVEDEEMPYVAGSNGDYRGILTDTVTSGLMREGTYCVQVTIDGGPGYRAYYEMSCCAHVRNELE